MITFYVIADRQQPTLHDSQGDLEDLIINIADGNMDALEKLYRCTYHAVYGFILSILKNPDNAEDVLQDTYVNIKVGAHLYEKRNKPLAWIFTIAKNLSYSSIRKNRYRDTCQYDQLDNQLQFSKVENKEDKLILEAAFKILSDEERQIIILHANTGMKHREIGNLLKLPLSTVLSKYNRALKKLKHFMKEVDFYE